MRTNIRVLIAVSMVAILTGMGLVLGVVYGIFYLVAIEGGLGAGGHAINSAVDGPTVMFTGTAIGAALGIGAALLFWHYSKPR